MADDKRETGWLARRREKRRHKRERTGDTPQKTAERRKPHDADVKDAMTRTGETGFLSGGF